MGHCPCSAAASRPVIPGHAVMMVLWRRLTQVLSLHVPAKDKTGAQSTVLSQCTSHLTAVCRSIYNCRDNQASLAPYRQGYIPESRHTSYSGIFNAGSSFPLLSLAQQPLYAGLKHSYALYLSTSCRSMTLPGVTPPTLVPEAGVAHYTSISGRSRFTTLLLLSTFRHNLFRCSSFCIFSLSVSVSGIKIPGIFVIPERNSRGARIVPRRAHRTQGHCAPARTIIRKIPEIFSLRCPLPFPLP